MAPMPAVPGVARVSFTWGDGISEFGSRIFIDTADPGATADDMQSLATQIEALYASDLNDNVSSSYNLVQVEAVDLTTDAGLAGYWRGSLAGGAAGEFLPSNVSMDLQLKIAPRYRGGHPVVHLPPPSALELGGPRQFTAEFVAAETEAGNDFLTGINELTIGTYPPCTWVVLRGYRAGATSESVTADPVLTTQARQYVGTVRRRARSLR